MTIQEENNHGLRDAYNEGLKSGQYWVSVQFRFIEGDDRKLNPYTTFSSGIRLHTAWRIGYRAAFVAAGKASPVDWQAKKKLYGLPDWLVPEEEEQ